MASTTKLIVYNEVMRELAGHPLANLTNVNTRLSELNGAFDHAVEYMLSKADWGFARRRATLTGVSDSAFPPYTYRYSKQSDYLRKCWLKTAANAFPFCAPLAQYRQSRSEQAPPACDESSPSALSAGVEEIGTIGIARHSNQSA